MSINVHTSKKPKLPIMMLLLLVLTTSSALGAAGPPQWPRSDAAGVQRYWLAHNTSAFALRGMLSELPEPQVVCAGELLERAKTSVSSSQAQATEAASVVASAATAATSNQSSWLDAGFERHVSPFLRLQTGAGGYSYRPFTADKRYDGNSFTYVSTTPILEQTESFHGEFGRAKRFRNVQTRMSPAHGHWRVLREIAPDEWELFVGLTVWGRYEPKPQTRESDFWRAVEPRGEGGVEVPVSVHGSHHDWWGEPGMQEMISEADRRDWAEHCRTHRRAGGHIDRYTSPREREVVIRCENLGGPIPSLDPLPRKGQHGWNGEWLVRKMPVHFLFVNPIRFSQEDNVQQHVFSALARGRKNYGMFSHLSAFDVWAAFCEAVGKLGASYLREPVYGRAREEELERPGGVPVLPEVVLKRVAGFMEAGVGLEQPAPAPNVVDSPLWQDVIRKALVVYERETGDGLRFSISF